MVFLIIGLILYAYIAVTIFCKCREVDEKNLKLKLIGYCLLGAASIPIKSIIIPAGFIIHLIRFKADTNREIKRSAAIIGVLIVICTFITVVNK